MPGKYKVLRKQLKNADYSTNIEIAELWGCSPMHVSVLLNGKSSFRQSVQYRTMDALHWPYEKMHILFPKDGIDIEDKRFDTVKAYCDEMGLVLVPRVAVQTLKTVIGEIEKNRPPKTIR